MKDSTRQLLRVLPRGYTIGSRRGSDGHPYVLRPDGEPLRGPDGVPVRVVGSPSDRRSIKTNVARIRRALKAQPEEPTR